ncbi:MAG: ABC transporter ATP-binding protein [Acidimicrobiia bacterium]|nr:MAG: ABC transporter ATP-binding protein [Acidimicrobiia bacterium]
MSSSAKAPSRPLHRLWRYAAGHRAQVMRASAWSVLNKAFDIAPPMLIGAAVDIVVRQEGSVLASFGVRTPRSQIVVLALITFGIWLLESLFEYLHGVAWRNLAQTIQHELRIDAYTTMQTLELRYFEDRATGDLMAVLNDDVNQLERFLDRGANEILQVLTTAILIGAIFFYLAPGIAWLAFLPVPGILWGSFRFQRRLEPRYAAVRHQAAAVNAELSNRLGGIATIKAFTAEDDSVRRIAVESERYRAANRGAIRLSSAFSPLIRVVILVGFTATLVWGGFRAIDGSLEVGAYSVMVFLTQRLLWPLTRLGETFDLYQRAMASTNRILDVIDTAPAIGDGTIQLEAGEVKGEIRFEDVTFGYQASHPVLHRVSLEIPAGRTTAFVGATGSGKTTLIKLLLRFYDVDSGRITVDGHDLRTLSTRHLRRSIGLVSQDVFLFHGTVQENIAYGRPEAPFEEIRAAAEVAEAHEFIESLPDGYETIVGERGQKLSGGQRQRVSIARAVLLDPPILALDEATSAVDNETEAAIQRSLEKLSMGRTTIVIAHRLSTIRHADLIYVLTDGRVVETGTHEELVAMGGAYRGLWDVQTGEAVPWHVDGGE